jgi:hypothetical protein
LKRRNETTRVEKRSDEKRLKRREEKRKEV